MSKLRVVCPMVKGPGDLNPANCVPMRHLVIGIDRTDVCDVLVPESEGDFDLAIGWGVRRKPLLERLAPRFLCIEMGFLGDRDWNCYLGFDGMNNLGQWREVPGREERWLDRMKPQKPVKGPLKRVLLLGQVPTDWTVRAVDDGNGDGYRDWLTSYAADLTAAGYDVRFRRHPWNKKEDLLPGVPMGEGSLDEDLDWAQVCTAFSSNGLTDAFLAGCPVVPVNEIAMTWPVRSTFAEIRRPGRDESVKWLRRVASAQWNRDELRSGEAWLTLRSMLRIPPIHGIR